MNLLNLGCGSRYHKDWINLDFKTLENVVVHSRLELKINAWGNNDNDTFVWDEASILVPFNENKFLFS